MYKLFIANKNYSSWSLRPWMLMRELQIPFAERLVVFGQVDEWTAYRRICPSGKVPCLMDGDIAVWDSLAIMEYLAEKDGRVWPSESVARAWARSAAAEMHSGFAELRRCCSMSCGVRVRLNEESHGLRVDLDRIAELWNEGLARFGGPFLGGKQFTAVDACFAPVVFRIQTYGLEVDAVSQAYVARLLARESMQGWYADALREHWRDGPHDREVEQIGTVLQDFRAPPSDTLPFNEP